MSDGTRMPMAAGIVAYQPDPVHIKALIKSLMRQVDLLLIYRNSALPAALRAIIQEHGDRLVVLGDECNLGLGTAHNRIVEAAMAGGFERILLFDQDSRPPPDLGRRLLLLMQRLIAAGERPAAVGPRPIAYDGTSYKPPPPLRASEAAPHGHDRSVEFIISSGSLINGAAFRKVGRFREDFFIDAIDMEWCLRARFHGFTCWMATEVTMQHRLGAGVSRMPLLNVHLVQHPAARAYTFVRNQLALFRLEHVPLRWKVRALARLAAYTVGQPVVASHWRATVSAVARGWRDGLLGRLGPP